MLCLFTPPKKNPQKWKNLLEISLFYICVPKITIVWYTVLEIWSETDKIIFVILGYFCPFTTPLMIPKMKILKEKKKEKNAWRYDRFIHTWNIRCDRQKFLSFWAIFCSFSPLLTWEIKILKLKKTPGDIILNIFTINDNHMYGFWNIERDRQNFLSFWTVFCPFTSIWTQKI